MWYPHAAIYLCRCRVSDSYHTYQAWTQGAALNNKKGRNNINKHQGYYSNNNIQYQYILPHNLIEKTL